METKDKKESTVRKKPLRRCVVCRESKTKDMFLRAVLTKSDGKISFDESGKGQGRGAYVCKSGDCMGKLLKQRGFNRSFKRDAGTAVYEEIAAWNKASTDKMKNDE